MNAAAQAYGRTARTGLTARQLEAEVLSQCALELEAVAQTFDSDNGRLIAAIERNRELWSILAMSMRDPSNPLPPDFKAGLREVAAFVFARTYRVARTMDRSCLASLARINREIAAGLRGQPVT